MSGHRRFDFLPLQWYSLQARMPLWRNWHTRQVEGLCPYFFALDFKYGKQIIAALLPMCLTVIFHGAGI